MKIDLGLEITALAYLTLAAAAAIVGALLLEGIADLLPYLGIR